MALETFGNNISTLVATNPTGADAKSTADDHIRGVKSVLLAQFPSLTAPVTATHTQLNFVTGVTSAIQTQLDAKAPTASPTFTGTPVAPTPVSNVNTTQVVNGAWVNTYYAPIASPTFTGVPVVPTPASNINTTQAVNGAWANTYYAPKASPTFSGNVTVPTPTSSTDAVTKAYADALSIAAGNVPVGGGTGQALVKNSATNYDTVWSTVTAGNSEVVLQTGNGYGSAATYIRRFTTIVTNVGPAITYADSATLGATFTINEPGLYSIHYADALGTAGVMTVSLNTASTSTGAISGAARIVYASAPAGTSFATSIARVVRLSSGDVLRCNTDLTGTANTIPFFAIRKVGV